MEIFVVNQDNKTDVEADIFSSVQYILHESFGAKARQTKKSPPFRVEEDGWGEFELVIVLEDVSGKQHTVNHDLNFAENRYEVKHAVTFKNPKAPLLQLLRASGPVPGDAVNGADKKRASDMGGEGVRKKKKDSDQKGVDMDRLAEGLQKLGEDDLLQVVQMVHDNKSEDSWMRNDIDRMPQLLFGNLILWLTTFTEGEFHVDLYTLPDSLIKMLWDFTSERNAIAAGA